MPVPMRKPTTDETNVQMSDVLCDFCRREWTEEIPMIEGHQGSCICGNCLRLAYRQVVVAKATVGDAGIGGGEASPYTCPLCLEKPEDRAAMDRADEPGWPSPLHPEAVICRRCIKRAAGALHKDPDFGWRKPE